MAAHAVAGGASPGAMPEEHVTEQVIRGILADSLHITDPTPEYLSHLIVNLRLAYGIDVEPDTQQTVPMQPTPGREAAEYGDGQQSTSSKSMSYKKAKPQKESQSFIITGQRDRNRLSGGLRKTDRLERHRSYEQQWDRAREKKRKAQRDLRWDVRYRMGRPHMILRDTDPVASYQDLSMYWKGDPFLDEKLYAKAQSAIAWETRCQLLSAPSPHSMHG
eukprot:TRINITY_DN35124_c0_g1_i1.p1 TRINITY_DN35124_c0_g1~~TRINITY_DN35124_c0_g1_i1.p1  ORF type:complete len:233 (+),score=43.29 TRINITY_DN35124_c0_g1_i1:43-699(+)